jgi:short-subunit dehydrogenase
VLEFIWPARRGDEDCAEAVSRDALTLTHRIRITRNAALLIWVYRSSAIIFGLESRLSCTQWAISRYDDPQFTPYIYAVRFLFFDVSRRTLFLLMKNQSSHPAGVALITGASSGIGLELAREFARNGHDLVIVAPVQTELDSIAEQLEREFTIDVAAMAADLEEPTAAAELFSAVEAAGLEIEFLCNNAGHGHRGKWWEQPIETDLSIVRLNVEAVLRMTKVFLPPMLERGHGRILITASVAGFEAGPMMATYHASKAFVLSWSEALATELQDTAVTVTALCPGPVDTDFFPKADMVETAAFQKANVMPPQEVAKTAYEALMKGERVIIPGGMNKAMIFSRRFLSESASSKKNEKMYEDVDPKDHQREPGDIRRKAEAKGAKA